MDYSFKEIERKWQSFWAANQTFKAEIDLFFKLQFCNHLFTPFVKSFQIYPSAKLGSEGRFNLSLRLGKGDCKS